MNYKNLCENVKSVCESVCWNSERFLVAKRSLKSYNHQPNKSSKTSIFSLSKILGNGHEQCCCSYYLVLPVKKKFLHFLWQICSFVVAMTIANGTGGRGEGRGSKVLGSCLTCGCRRKSPEELELTQRSRRIDQQLKVKYCLNKHYVIFIKVH